MTIFRRREQKTSTVNNIFPFGLHRDFYSSSAVTRGRMFFFEKSCCQTVVCLTKRGKEEDLWVCNYSRKREVSSNVPVCVHRTIKLMAIIMTMTTRKEQCRYSAAQAVLVDVGILNCNYTCIADNDYIYFVVVEKMGL